MPFPKRGYLEEWLFDFLFDDIHGAHPRESNKSLKMSFVDVHLRLSKLEHIANSTVSQRQPVQACVKPFRHHAKFCLVARCPIAFETCDIN